MTYVGAIANEGERVTPTLIGDTGLRSILWGNSSHGKQILSVETAAKLKEMMRNDVIEEYGERGYQDLELCAKSGTAQVGDGEEPHSWFVGFLDREDCPLAFVVVVENGGSGSKVAGAVAGKVLKEAVSELTTEAQ
jgi:peptidoglycan glycosyltransferase